MFSCRERHTRPGPSGFADVSFADELSTVMPAPDTVCVKPGANLTEQDVRLAYATDDHQPIWVRENYSSNKAAATLIAELEEMQWDGAPAHIYDMADIKLLREKLDTTKKNSVKDAIRFDTMLTRRYLAAAKFLLFGELLPRRADSLWYHANDSEWSAPQLLATSEGGYPALDEYYRSEWPTYRLLRKAYKHYYELSTDSNYLNAVFNMQPGQNDSVMHTSMHYIIEKELPWLQIVPNDTISDEKQRIMAYQNYLSLRVTGKADSATIAGLGTTPEVYMKRLRANMERIRWMRRKVADTFIIVNVPLMELFFRRNGEEIMHKRVVVGRPARQTPSLQANMANVVINPPWGVPPTILKNDVLPGIQKSGDKYLAKKGLKVYDNKGKAVNVATINAKNYRRYNYKQAPGHDNSLGYVKFNMPNKWDIYLHDTPHREDFAKRDRALSSGCVRVHKPMELAELILSGFENKKQYTQGKLDSLSMTHKTRWETLKNKIPVCITYLTAFEDSTSTHIRFARDIYQRDAKLIAMMK
ncbi:L,D-transpeptidase family protein [Nemorincola caseinilytica]|uniref:L,D-transpeptidase family protein n=1 Tax=Nemorincola caseinilytica TaxID=2054315 RepID=A0ABP8NLC9_9BACT